MSISESDRVVFLLGAGFSAESELPVMKRFADSARRLYFAHKKAPTGNERLVSHYDAMFGFQVECERSAGALLRDWENIEELYMQADLRRLASLPTREKSQALCASIAWVIWDVYRRGVPLLRQPTYIDVFPDALARVRSESGLTPVLVTTNYDLVAESALSRVGTHFAYPSFSMNSPTESGLFACVPEHDTQEIGGPEVVDVIKLHGSVNWFIVDGKWWSSKIVQNTGATNSVASPVTNHDRVLMGLHDVNTACSTDTIQPALIPPMLGKAAVAPVIASQWRSAINAIARARVLVVIGYSFPETDTFMARLLSEGLHANTDVEEVFVVDIGDAERWHAKLAALLHPVFISKKAHFVPRLASEVLRGLSRYGLAELRTMAST